MSAQDINVGSAAGPLRRVLVIAYYFPPMGLSGVQRVAGFAKHLPRHGWHPTVVTAKPAGYFAYDQTLRAEVEATGAAIVSTRSMDPTRLFGRRRVVPLPSESVRRPLTAISRFVFAPDNKVGWIPFAVRAGAQLHRAEPFDAVFASAPPYSGLLAARRIAARHNLPLVVDFRDDWVGHPVHRYATRWHRWINLRMERRVLRRSTTVTAINRVIRDSLAKRSPDHVAIVVLPHGHDVGAAAAEPVRGDRHRMQFLYTGVFYDAQTPDHFLRALAMVASNHPAIARNIEARFLGLMPARSLALVADLGLEGMVIYGGYVPHAEAVAAAQAADVLWMTVGERPGAHGITTSKLSEYMGCRKPILALIPQGAAQETLESYGAARVVRPRDVDGIAGAIVDLFEAWQAGVLPVPDAAYVQARSRNRITGLLAGYLTAGLAPVPRCSE